MNRVKFYSEYDGAFGWELDKVIKRIVEHSIDKEWLLNDVIEFYNILKYIQVERFAKYLQEKTGIICDEYKKQINTKIGKYLAINKNTIIYKYDEEDFVDTEDYLEILDKYSVYKEISDLNFKAFIHKEHVPIYMVLKHKKIVDYFDTLIKDEIISDSYNAEIIISKYLDDRNLNLPSSLKEIDVLSLIDVYIDSDRVNINELRKIINFPKGKGLIITDKIKLHAIRKEKEEADKLFINGSGIVSSVSIEYEKGLKDEILFNKNGREVSVLISRDFIEANMDYPTLWGNFTNLFGLVDNNVRLTVVSKIHDMSALESAFGPSGNHLYNKSIAFGFREMFINAEIYSYIRILNILMVRIEDMIEWFFNEYLEDVFSINNFIVKMPTEGSSYFEKCRTILPEIDRIFKQYNELIEDGEIDQELIQISSSSIKIKEVKSFISRKYAYPIGEWYQRATFLLFSDQSGIFYIPKKEKKYKSFFDLIMCDDVKKSDFNQYQIKNIDWLIKNDIIIEIDEGNMKIVDYNCVFILKELYYEDVLNYWHYQQNLRDVIDTFEDKGIVFFESSLLSKNEQDYLDFYLNKAKFTNGYDLRNRYSHGTNANDEKQNKLDYYSIIKLIIFIIIKLHDDLILKDFDLAISKESKNN